MLTERRRLSAGQSIWQARRPHLPIDALEPGADADAVVIGTGISGALVADALIRSGLKVVAVDRRPPLSGSTSASTALLEFQIDTPLGKLAEKVGKQAAARAWLRSVEAVRDLEGRIRDLDIRCGYRERLSLYLAGEILDAPGLKRETELRQTLGLRSEFLDRSALAAAFGVRKSGAILSRGAGEADPVKLTAGLWRRNRARGARLVVPFDAAAIDETRSRTRVVAADGRHIDARHVVLCAGYERSKFVHCDGYKVTSTWALATAPQEKRLWPKRALVWEASEPYLYLRTTADGRAIVGGEDEPFADEKTRDALSARKFAAIAKKAARIFPDIDFAPDYAWTGNFGDSETGLPRIGRPKGFRRTYAVMGFGGNGITFSMLAAQIVSREIGGFRDPDAEIFRF